MHPCIDGISEANGTLPARVSELVFGDEMPTHCRLCDEGLAAVLAFEL
jgi:hypothetical protein